MLTSQDGPHDWIYRSSASPTPPGGGDFGEVSGSYSYDQGHSPTTAVCMHVHMCIIGITDYRTYSNGTYDPI